MNDANRADEQAGAEGESPAKVRPRTILEDMDLADWIVGRLFTAQKGGRVHALVAVDRAGVELAYWPRKNVQAVVQGGLEADAERRGGVGGGAAGAGG